MLVFGNGDLVFVEGGLAASVAELANGDEGTVGEARYDVGFACFVR